MMGTGKSYWSKKLSKKWKVGGYDLDFLIESHEEKTIAEIFAEIGRDPLMTARKILTYLKVHPDPAALAVAARRLIFLKGTDSHDYKYSSAVFEDHALLTPAWRDRYLAAAAFQLKGSSDPDNQLVQRTRAALS